MLMERGSRAMTVKWVYYLVFIEMLQREYEVTTVFL